MRNLFKKLPYSSLIANKIRETLVLLGVDLRQRTEDRDILEKTIFTYLAKQNVFQKIVFIGTNWYTKGYCKIFNKKEFYTLEYSKERARFGCKLNIVDSFVNIDKYFKENDVDCVICNGVFGRGFDAEGDINKAFLATHKILRKNGLFVFGFDDVKEFLPFEIEKNKLIAAGGGQIFQKHIFEPLNTNRYECKNKHIYLFFTK